MRHSWISAINLIILITASIVVNMNANSTTYNGHPTSTESIQTITEEWKGQTNGLLIGKTQSPSYNEATSVSNKYMNITDSADPDRNETQTNDSTQAPGPTEPAYRAFIEYDIYRFLVKNSVWFNALPGIILNPICIYVTKSMKPFTPTSLCIVVLAANDFVLVFARFVFDLSAEDLFTDTECVVIFGILNVTLTYSNFVLLVWTLERLIAVRFPLNVTSWCSMRNTKIALTTSFVIVVLLSIPYFLYSGMDVYGGCMYQDFIDTEWSLVDNAYYIWIPMFIICIANVCILYNMRKTVQARAAMTQNTESKGKGEREQKQLTVALVTICMAFLMFHTPQLIETIIARKYPDPFVLYDDPKAFIQFFLYQKLASEWLHIQNNINFILYCSTGQKFRQTFKRTICFWRANQQGADIEREKTSVTVITKGV